LPGVGLLLLRVAAGLTAAAEALSLFQGGATDSLPAAGLMLLLFAGGVFLCSGILTPLSALAIAGCAAALGLDVVPSGSLDVLDDGLATLLLISAALAIALLGPGAYSLDSYLFGRREIVIKRPLQS
jgi:uncharacterized membrane protein YphA (DoxX/SURF4 family)